MAVRGGGRSAETQPSARQITGAMLPETPLPVVATTETPDPLQFEPLAKVSAVFNASNQTVLPELRDFARGRTNYESALQEDRFLADIDSYTRFVCHAMVRRLLELQQVAPSDR